MVSIWNMQTKAIQNRFISSRFSLASFGSIGVLKTNNWKAAEK